MATSPAANTVCGTWPEHCCWIPPTPEEETATPQSPTLGQCPHLRDDGATWRTKRLPRRWTCTLIEAQCKALGVTVLDDKVKAAVRATPEHQAIAKRIHDHLDPYVTSAKIAALPWTDCLDWPGTKTCNLCGRTG